VTNMTAMFKNCTAFNGNIGSWDVSKVTIMTEMFRSATAFNQNIGNWNVSMVQVMPRMFEAATAFNQNIGSWNVSNVLNMLSMFSGASSFNQNIGNWDVSKVETMSNLFNSATAFNQNLGNWNISLVNNMTGIFTSTAMSATNYDNTLIGWAALPTVVSNVTVGANGLKYCLSVNARNSLINDHNWTFSGDVQDCPTFNTTWSTGAPGESVIIPTTGTGYDYYVDWGDGNVDYNVTGNASHNYATPGTHTVKIYGDFPRIYFNSSGHLTKIRSIEQWGDNQWESMENAFYGCSNLVNNATDAPDLSQVTSMAGMFRNASNFNSDLSNWDVSTVTDMTNMLNNTALTYFNYDNTLTAWAALPALQSNVTLGALNVLYCESENAARQTLINSKNWTIVDDKRGCPFITTWETNPSKQVIIPVTSGTYKYYVEWGDGTYTRHLNTTNAQHTYADAGTYTVKVSGTFPRFFGGSYANPYIKTIEQWGDIHWTSMYRAFSGCTSLVSNATDAPDLSNVTILTEMFLDATSFDGDLSNWDVSNITHMSSTFNQANSFNGDISTWDVSNVQYMNNMFSGATVFNSDIVSWDVGSVINMDQMFRESAFNQDISGWNVSNVTTMYAMFHSAATFNQAIGNWNVSAVTDMSGMFNGSIAFNQPLNGWDVSNVTDMSDMFSEATSFNQDINNWDLSSATRLDYMFYNASSFNSPLDNWNTTAISEMQNMFAGATAFNQDISGWDVSNVSSMSEMFYEATSFNQDISGWDISNAYDIYGMFYGATSFNQDISNWVVSNINDLESMFEGATSFNQNLSSWDVSNVEYMAGMFDNSGMSRRNYDQTLIGWEALPSLQPDVNIGVSGLSYCVGATAHAALITDYNWIFTGDTQDCANTAPTDIALSKTTIASNNNIGAIIGILSTVDEDVNDTFTYALVAGEGDTDNTSFAIDGNNLVAAEVFDYLIKSEYSLRIQSDDWIDTYEKSFIINITEEDLIAPALVTLSPANNSTDIAINTALSLTYDEELIAGSGTAEIREFDTNNLVESFDITDAVINVNELSLTPDNVLNYGTKYTVIIPGTFVKDASENFSSAINGSWVFTTIKDTQTITFGALSNATFGDAAFELTATATSGLAISYTSSDESVATISGSNVTIIGAGSTEITASQSGNENYDAAADVIQTLVINKANQSISVEAIADKETTDAPFDVVATSTSGLAVSLSVSGPASISASTITLDGTEGTVTLTASQAGNDNYLAAADEVITFEVTSSAIAQTITFNPIEDQFFEAGSLTLTATASSGLDVSYEIVSGPATVSGNVVSFADLGTVVVSASQAGNEEFLPADAVEQSFEIITVTGFEDEVSAVLIYPNPASTMLTIQTQREGVVIKLLNMNGSKVMDVRPNVVHNISHLDKGIYILRIMNAQGSTTHKIIKN
jgi:surface protein